MHFRTTTARCASSRSILRRVYESDVARSAPSSPAPAPEHEYIAWEHASPQGRTAGRIAGRESLGEDGRSTGRGASVRGPSGGALRAWLASGTTRRTARSTFRTDATDPSPLVFCHGRPRTRAHWSGAPQRYATPHPRRHTSTSQPAASSSTPSDPEPATRRCTNTSCSSSRVCA